MDHSFACEVTIDPATAQRYVDNASVIAPCLAPWCIAQLDDALRGLLTDQPTPDDRLLRMCRALIRDWRGAA